MEMLDIKSDQSETCFLGLTLTGTKENPGKPDENPEAEPEKLPKENPGISPEEPDEDDDDENDPWEEPEIGDDPDEVKTKTTIM